MSADVFFATTAREGAGPQEDLDAVAERYVEQRRLLSTAQARRHRDEMINHLIPFADRLARRYRTSAEPADDLKQVARMGLVKAVDRYDPERGSFTAFAAATIGGELKRHFRDHTWGVHVPRRVQGLTLAVVEAQSALTGELGRAPTDVEVAARCEVTRDAVDDARRSSAGYRPASLNMPVGESGGQLADLIGSPDAAIELVADQEAMRDLIDQLPERERRILLERFYGNRTQSDIAADIGISQMHVSRLLSRALAAMRAAMLSDERPALLHSAEAAGPVISVRPQASGAICVLLAGEIDRDNAGRLRHELLGLVRRARPDSRMEIDLTAVPLIDAAGINALFGGYQAARARGVTMTLVGMQPFVARTVVESGLRSLMS